MGWLWPVLHPLLMLSIYTYVFGSVFGARWGHSIPVNNRWHFALMLFSGLICFNMIAECISRSPVLIVSQVNYVKRVVFPLEIISVVQIGAVLFQAMLNLFVLSIFMLLSGDGNFLFVPLVLIVLVIFSFLLLGLSWILSAIGVYVRDLEQIVPTIITGLMFLSPIFYALDVLSPRFRLVLMFNPLTHVIELVRSLLFGGPLPGVVSLLVMLLISILVAYIGLWFFKRASRGFADVL